MSVDVSTSPTVETLSDCNWLFQELVDWQERIVAPRSVERPSTDKEIDPATEAGQREIEAFTRYLHECPAPVEGNNPCSGTLWTACAVGVKHHCLPTATVFQLVKDHLNPRAVKADGVTFWPFSDEEIRHKVEEAAKHSTLWRSEDASAEKIQKMVREVLENGPRLVRVENPTSRVKDATHEYSFQGDEPPAPGKCTAMPLHLITDALLCTPEWAGVLQYDEFADRSMAVNPPLKMDLESSGLTEEDCTWVAKWFATKGYLASPENIRRSIKAACRKRAFHPIKMYLESLPPCEDPELIQVFAREILGVEDIEAECLEKFLVSAVRRIYQPGCQVDSIIVLVGDQGLGKSSFAREMFSPWYRSQMPSLEGRDASHALLGYWGVEFSELASMSAARSSRETVKDFLTRQEDTYREFGSGERITRKRTSVFVGTTNEERFLIDPTGARRYWPIRVPNQWDVDTIRQMRNELWACALLRASDVSYKHYFTDLSKLADQHAKHQEILPWQDIVTDYCSGREAIQGAQEIWTRRLASNSDMKAFDQRAQRLICDCLKNVADQKNTRINGESKRVWKMKERIRNREPSEREKRLRESEKAVGQ